MLLSQKGQRFQKGGGLTIMELGGHGGGRGNAFWNFEGKGGIEYGNHTCLGMDIFWNSPIADYPS